MKGDDRRRPVRHDPRAEPDDVPSDQVEIVGPVATSLSEPPPRSPVGRALERIRTNPEGRRAAVIAEKGDEGSDEREKITEPAPPSSRKTRREISEPTAPPIDLREDPPPTGMTPSSRPPNKSVRPAPLPTEPSSPDALRASVKLPVSAPDAPLITPPAKDPGEETTGSGRRPKELGEEAGTGTGRRPKITAADPRLDELEPVVASGNWKELCRRLGPPEESGKLPPPLGLLYALARRESGEDGESGSASNELAIRCVAALMGVREGGPIAVVVAKRMLRQIQRGKAGGGWGLAILFLVIGLALGAAAAWFVAHGFRFPLK